MHHSPTGRYSWPPTQVRLMPTTPKDYPSLDDIDEDPLTYFLTPAPDLEVEDVDMMDFDAGIEGNSPREIVRSVSPSSLDALNRAKGRKSPPVPDLSDLATPEEDGEEEDYIRFSPHGFTVPSSLRDFTIDGVKSKRSKTHSEALLTPSSPTRGRAPSRPGGRGRQHSVTIRHRERHVWREPSPDVWSIEEETEEELLSEIGSSNGAVSDMEEDGTTGKDVEAAKPKKKVRFLLPAKQ